MQRRYMAHVEAGKRAIESERYEDAYRELSQALYILEESDGEGHIPDESLAEMYAMRALALFASDEGATKNEPDIFNQVMDDWDHAIDLNPTRVGYRNLRAQLFLDCGFADYSQEAQEEAEQVLSQLPHQKDALRLAGEAYRKQGKPDKALYYFGLALEQEVSKDVLLARAAVYAGMQPAQLALAIRDLQKAKELAPTETEIYLRRAAYLEAMGEIQTAIEEYDQLINISNKAAYFVSRGNLYLDINPTRARVDYDRAIQIGGEAEAYNNRACLYMAEGNYAAAIQDAEAALALDPSCTIAYATLAEVYASKKDDALFYKHLELALEHYYTDYLDAKAEPAFAEYAEEAQFELLIQRFKDLPLNRQCPERPDFE